MYHIFLDLDESLIHTSDFITDTNKLLEIKTFKKHIFNFREINSNGILVNKKWVIFERPYCQEFLDWLFQNFHVSIFTAASKDYENLLLIM